MPKSADEMINHYRGMRAFFELLRTYAEDYKWDAITRKVEDHVTDNHSRDTDMLKLAGVRVAANLMHSSGEH